MTGHPEGTLLRVTGFTEGFDARVGEQFEVEDYVSAEDAEDGVAFYYGSNHGGFNNVVAAAGPVELVMTAEAMRARKVPTCAEVARGLSLTGYHEVFDADESEPDGDVVNVYGATPDGLRVAVTLHVVRVEQVDW